MSKNRFGLAFAAALITATLGGGVPAMANEIAPISLPTETSYQNVNINTVGNNWISDGSTTIWTRGYARVKLTRGTPRLCGREEHQWWPSRERGPGEQYRDDLHILQQYIWQCGDDVSELEVGDRRYRQSLRDLDLREQVRDSRCSPCLALLSRV